MEVLQKCIKDKSNLKELKRNFKESLQDDTFENFVSCLKVDEKELFYNRSNLEEAKMEYTNCLNCKNLLACKNKITGYAYLPKVQKDHLVFGYKECRYKHKIEKQNKHLENIYLVDVPKELQNAKMKDIYKDDMNRFSTIKYLVTYVSNYKKGKVGKGLYLYGSFGCGKTYLIASVFNELAKENVKSAILFWPEFLRNLKSSFGSDFEEKMTKIKKVELLLIDDIGAETTTAWGRDEILGPILQYRMNEKLPTFFTSNLSLEELEIHLGNSKDKIEEVKAKRLIERIRQLANIEKMVSENLRK